MQKTTIVVLLFFAAGTGAFFSSCKRKASPYDMITVDNQSDSIIKKVKIFAADNPSEIYYDHGRWMQQDSTPLRSILDGKATDTMTKAYRTITLYITYDDRYFYDVELDKRDTTIGYDMHFQFHPIHDTMFLLGNIDEKKNGIVRFRDPMLGMYKQFILTYNQKIPRDSVDEDSGLPTAKPATKTITVIEN